MSESGNGSHALVSSTTEAASAEEARDIIDRARADAATPMKKAESSEDFRFDPIPDHRARGTGPDGSVNAVHALVNRTVFFDYFRHVAHKRFPELPPEDRVQALTEKEPDFYRRSIRTDFLAKVVTHAAAVSLAILVVVKALFF